MFINRRLTARVTGGWKDETHSRNGKNPKPQTKPFWRCESSRPRARRVGWFFMKANASTECKLTTDHTTVWSRKVISKATSVD